MTTMTNDNTPDTKQTSSWKSIAVMVLAGFVLGYVGFNLGSAAAGGGPGFSLTLSEIAALTVSAILVFCGLIVALGTAWPAVGIRMSMFEDMDQWEDERGLMWLSVIGCSAFGGALGVLALAQPLALMESVPVLVVIIFLTLVFSYSAWVLMKRYDELWVGVNGEACTIGFYLTFATGGLWSIVAHLGFVGALAPLDWITVLGATSLIGAIMATHRRGLLRT